MLVLRECDTCRDPGENAVGNESADAETGLCEHVNIGMKYFRYYITFYYKLQIQYDGIPLSP